VPTRRWPPNAPTPWSGWPAREHLTRIDAAMSRLADGTYGICERCGQPIAAARPVATTCMDCASRRR